MSFKADNAVILAAGLSSRFLAQSGKIPKGLATVKGEVLAERQIRQLREAGIDDIYLVTGHMAEKFAYLADTLGVKLIHNPEYSVRNNHSSIHAVRAVLGNTYICSVDNYFTQNPFETEVEESYYAGLYAPGETKEWCMETDENDYIRSVTVGGRDSWYMMGHAFWSREFSEKFLELLEKAYDLPETKSLLWEDIFVKHLDELRMKLRRYEDGVIYEFDTVEELRAFDPDFQSL